MAASVTNTARKVGIVGYGKLGQYLAKSILEAPASAGLEIAFVWNRTASKIREDDRISENLVLEDLGAFAERKADLIVEVAHPAITEEYGAKFLEHADFFCGSPTCFADRELEERIRAAAGKPNGHGLYVPAGALWGAMDIQKMAARGQLRALKVTMKKHPSSFRVYGTVAEKLAAVHATAKEAQEGGDGAKALEGPPGEHVLYEGPVRALCPLAPNNVNTMACAALASGAALGFDGTQALLIADYSLEAHVIEIDVKGPEKGWGDAFRVSTLRHNPAKPGAVTGNATYASFYSSLVLAGGRGDGVHLC